MCCAKPLGTLYTHTYTPTDILFFPTDMKILCEALGHWEALQSPLGLQTHIPTSCLFCLRYRVCFTLGTSRVFAKPKESYLQLCQNYWTISLISHPSKVMLKVLLNLFQSAICFKQEISNLLLHNPLNTSEMKFNWGLNVSLWSRMSLYLIVFNFNTVKLLAVSF